ncbi:MAG: patatin family protein [Clostridiales bacterium]|nr:patatin family protein [Clostridiales bacterium]
MKTALVLEGGGMRGLYTAGVLDTLLDTDIHFDTIVGVSAGALFGVNYKSRQNGRALRYNIDYAHDSRYMSVWSLITTGDIMGKDFCFNKLVHELSPFDFDTYSSTPEALYAVVTDIDTGKPEYVRLDTLRGDEMEYLRASGSLPYVSRPVNVGGKRYLDGGLSDSIPVDWAINEGYDRIVVVLTRPADYRKKQSNERIAKLFYHNYPNLVSAINTRPDCYNAQVERVFTLERAGRITVIRPTRHIDIGRLEKDTAVMQRMYDLGVKDMTSSIERVKTYISAEK